jgi:predicted  nucleic acid-binding Zn-ribbon protein
MSIDFRKLTGDLRVLIGRLKKRCIEAEARATDLQRQLDEQQEKYKRLEMEKAELDKKYQYLRSGLAASGNDPEQMERLKKQYLAMVSEIDACIQTLQHG